MTDEQRTMITAAHKSGVANEDIARTVMVSVEDLKIFLAHWVDTAGM